MFLSGIADEAGKPLETQIRAHRELGWKHIEVRNVDDTSLSYATDDQFDRIHEKLQEAEMQVSCFAGAIANWARDIHGPFETDADELRRSIPRMHKMGTPFIRIMSYANTSKVNETEWRKEAIHRIRELALMAEDGGITLVHENCTGWAGLGPEQTLQLIEEVDSPALRLVYDTGNVVHHDQEPWNFYSQVRDYIVYVHIKDYAVLGETKTATYPGEGKGDVCRVVTDLLKRGYDGGFSIEPHMAAVVHEGTQSKADVMYRIYTEYGRRMTAMMEDICKA